MKRLLLLILSSLLLVTISNAQIYRMNPSLRGKTYTVCKGMFTSSGFQIPPPTGYPVNFYSVLDTGAVTFCSGGGPIRVNFNYVNFQYAGEKMDVFDGPSTSSPLLRTITGWQTNDHIDVTSTGTCLTFKLAVGWSTTTNGSMKPTGFQGFIGCLPTGCNGNAPAGDLCANAPVICNLNGYCGSTSGWYTADNVFNIETVLNGCSTLGTISIQNNSWLAFIANSTTATLNVTANNCSDASNGIQAVIFETSDCNTYTPVSSCVFNSKSFTLSSTTLVVGKKYYIMIDGATGNDCDYTVTANTGVEYTSITPTSKTICEGDPVSITASGGTSYKWLPGGQTGATLNVSPTSDITYTCEITGKCALQKLTSVITVNPKPVVTATPSSQALCSGNTTSIALTSSPGTTFAWTVNTTGGPVSGSFGGVGSSISQTLTTSNPGAVTYNVTPTSGLGCKGNVVAVPVTVDPVPVLTTTPSSQTFCSGGTTNIALTSTVAGTTYVWTVKSVTGVSGAADGTGTPIAQTLTATGTVAGTVTYEITPVTPAPASCPGVKKTVTITVNPRPVITPTVASQTLCSGGTTSIGLQSDIPGTTYSWPQPVVTGGVTGSGPGSGSNIIQTLYTNGATPGTVEYTITATTPAPAGCTNSAVTKVLVTVNPIPTITINTPAAICGGQSVSLTATVAPLDPSGTFLWTPGNLTTQTINVTPTAPGGSYNVQYTLNGCSNSASRNVTVNALPSVSINTSSSSICAGKTTTLTASSPNGAGTFVWTPGGSGSSITVSPATTTKYVVTYTNGATGCAKKDSSTITVKALPTMTVTPTSSSICAGASTTLNTTVNPAGGTYLWMPSGKNTISITETPASSTTYTLTYTATNGCSRSNSSAAITVTPLEDASFSYLKSTYCGNAADTVPIITGKPGGTFTWTPAGLIFLNTTTGEIRPNGSTLNTYSITYTTNGTCKGTKTVDLTIASSPKANFTYQFGAYCQYAGTASPVFNNSSAGTFSSTPAGLVFVSAATGVIDLNTSTPGNYQVRNIIPKNGTCSADTSAWVPVTITAAPVLVPSTKSQSVCSPGATSITLSGAASYDWTVTSPATITGASAVTGNVTGSIIQTLTNSDIIPGVVHYVITPKAGTCIGKSDSIHVTVNPVPSVSATPVTPSVCSGLITNIILSSNIPTATFSWTVQSSIGAINATNGSGSVIAQALTATTSSPGTVVYRITPTAFGTCDGNYIDVPVTVNPNPTTVITIPPADQTICSGETTNIHISSSTPFTDFSWTVSSSGISGASNGTGTDINQLLIALGNTPGKAIYTITGKGSLTGCSGASAIDSVTVNPIPTLIVTPLNQEICSGAQINIALVSNLPGTTFSWTVIPNSVTGASNGSTTVGNIIQTLSNPGSVSDTAIYHIVATAGGCTSKVSPLVDSVEAKIVVNPKPVVAANTPTSICSGDTTNIVISSNVAGSTFTYKATTASVDGSSDGAGSLIKQGLSVNFITDSVIYTITPTSEQGCIGNPFKSIVFVNPRPVISFLPSSNLTICSGTQVSVFVVSNVPGALITWTPRASIITGTKTGTGTSPALINDILSIPGDTAATVIYDVTASKNGCTNSKLASLLQFTVNPLPSIIPSLESTSICNGDSIKVDLSSNVSGTNFNWTVTQTGVTGAVADSGKTSIKQTLKLTGTSAGTVIYTLSSYSSSGCKSASTKNIVITVNPLDNPAFNYSAAKYCQNEADPSAIITGGSPGIFTFSPVGLILDPTTGKIDLKASKPGDYNIEFKTTGKCSQTGYQNVTINPAPIANTSLVSIGGSSCGTNTGTITGITTTSGTAPLKYEWKNSAGVVVDTNLALTGVPPGSYILKITDANGCTTTVGNGNSLSVTNVKTVTAAFTSDVSDGQLPLDVQFYNQSTSTGVINYNWNFDNGSTSTVKDPAVRFNEIKVYNVCLYVDDGGKGCKDTACASIEVFTNSDISIIPNVFTPNGDGINDILMITAKGLGTVNAQIFNRWGQKQYEWNTINGGWDGYSETGVPAVEGTYYLILNATGADKNKTAFPTIKQSFTLIR